jgi:hypothetical protein
MKYPPPVEVSRRGACEGATTGLVPLPVSAGASIVVRAGLSREEITSCMTATPSPASTGDSAPAMLAAAPIRRTATGEVTSRRRLLLLRFCGVRTVRDNGLPSLGIGLPRRAGLCAAPHCIRVISADPPGLLPLTLPGRGENRWVPPPDSGVPGDPSLPLPGCRGMGLCELIKFVTARRLLRSDLKAASAP